MRAIVAAAGASGLRNQGINGHKAERTQRLLRVQAAVAAAKNSGVLSDPLVFFARFAAVNPLLFLRRRIRNTEVMKSG